MAPVQGPDIVAAYQLIALSAMLGVILWCRRSAGFARGAIAANVLILVCGFVLTEQQLAGYFVHSGATASTSR